MKCNGRSDDVDIIISNNSSKPIYEQIISQIKAMIMSGELQSGESCHPCARWQNHYISV